MSSSSLVRPSRAALRLLSDERLVELSRRGHETAFEAIFARYRGPLLRFSGGILPASRAEDAVQQAFLALHRELGERDSELMLRPWLFRVTRNACLDALRQNGWDHEQLDPNANGVARPEQVLDRSERLREVVRALKELPDSQREAIVLRELEGRSHHEIAADLGITTGAVRQLIHRGRTRLRDAAGALLPAPLVSVLAGRSAGAPDVVRLGEVAGAGGVAAALKMGAAAIVTATLAVPPVVDKVQGDRHRDAGADAAAAQQRAPVALAAAADRQANLRSHNRSTPGGAKRAEGASSGPSTRSRHDRTGRESPGGGGGIPTGEPRAPQPTQSPGSNRGAAPEPDDSYADDHEFDDDEADDDSYDEPDDDAPDRDVADDDPAEDEAELEPADQDDDED